jgi:glutaredoxin
MNPGRVDAPVRREVTVVSKKGCRLCDKVVAALNSLSSRFDLEVTVVDIGDDPTLHDKYWLTIPAVLIDGKDVFDVRHMGGEVNYAIMLEQLLMAYDSTQAST